jgi:hypothetical protein
MNDLDAFAEVALAIFLALTLLIWLLTYLERNLVRPITEERAPRVIRRRKDLVWSAPEDPVSHAPPDND